MVDLVDSHGRPRVVVTGMGVKTPAGVVERLLGGRHGELGEAVGAPGLLGPEPRRRVPVVDPALARSRRGEEAGPERVEPDACRRDDTDAGDGDPSLAPHLILPTTSS